MQNNPEPCPPRTLNLTRQHERRETFQQRGDSNLTLEPGDVIFTGTPTGAGARFDPPRFLEPGDVVEVNVPEIGTLRNGVRDE